MAKQKQSKQSRQSKKKRFQNESGQALKSLLNDQVETSLKREISISHGDSVSVTGGQLDSKQAFHEGNIKESEAQPAVEGQNHRKMPGSRETKARIMERMQKLLEEMERLEGDYYYIQTQLDQAMQHKKEYDRKMEQLQADKERLEDEVASKAKLLSQHQSREMELKSELNKNIQAREELEQKIRSRDENLDQEIQQKDQQISELKSEMEKHAQARKGLEDKLQDREERLEKEVREKSGLVSEVESLKANAGELQDSIARLEQQNKNLAAEKKELKDNLEKMKKKNEDKEIHEETGGKMPANDWRKRADKLWNGVSYTAPQQAIEFLSAAIEQDPKRAELHNDRGLANMDEYRMQESLNDFSTAINLKPDFGEAYHNRGVVLLKQGKEFAARKDFQMAATHGVWMGFNYLQQPKHSPGVLEKIFNVLGIKKR